jgi:hypothetical protein
MSQIEPHLVLFSPSASQATSFASDEDFENCLYFHLMLNPGTLVSPDPFFTSTRLRSYFLKNDMPGESLYEVALRRKWLVPFVRYPEIDSFEEIQRRQVHIANQGDRNLARLAFLNKEVDWSHHWPSNMGARFAARVQKNFVEPISRGILTERIPINVRGQHLVDLDSFVENIEPFCMDVLNALNDKEANGDLRMSLIYK